MWLGNYLLSSSLDGLAKVWDLREGCQMFTIRAHGGAANLGLDFSPAGDYFGTGGHDKLVHTWRTNFASSSSAVSSVAPGVSIPAAAPLMRPRSSSRPKTAPHPSVLSAPKPVSIASQPKTDIQSPSLSEASVPAAAPEDFGSVLQRIVSQLDLIGRSLSVFEERLTLSESKVPPDIILLLFVILT